ncbi:MAG: protein O-mannosyl-transferase family, partial [Vicinamibacterales bacterium]
AEISGSIAAGAAAALLFAVSYTFWSQAIIAEVYALHAIFVLLSLRLLLRWSARPTTGRLALFFACYALGFGNHLSMVLLAPAFTAYLLVAAPRGWRSMFAPRIVTVAAAFALAGSLQYLWNIRTLWLLPNPPHSVWSGLQTFWFDVTKSDWRETMVWNVPESMLSDRLAMYWFDLRQQFGVVGPLLAALGVVWLVARRWRLALLLALLYAVNVLFAFGYNVGDAHVFYLPSHLVLALLAAAGIAGVARGSARLVPALAMGLALYAGARAYRDYPALDRSADRRPAELLRAFTEGLDDQHAVVVTDLDWQVANGLSYYSKVTRPDVATVRMLDVLLYAPVLVDDNRVVGRAVVITERARAELAAAYGPLLPAVPDDRAVSQTLTESVSALPPGTRYVLCMLKPLHDQRLDALDLDRALRTLGDGAAVALPAGDYAAVAGRVGARPQLMTASPVPFAQRVTLGGVDVDIRMESWLSVDTIRRMGFGQVVAARHHTLIVERGVSFAAFDESGHAVRTAYSANIFAPIKRYLVARGS